ncbi:GNAT family N-acetyltransferase [Chloroflexi bacterium TSY]|nr:GNAT family N-acetyltransferase [Chloroflexi bacterium TSY]
MKLTHATNHGIADTVLDEVITKFEQTFPERIQSYYLMGSYAEGVVTPTSDLDLVVLFHGNVTSDETERAMALGEQCAQDSPIRLDIELADCNLTVRQRVYFKQTAQLLYGQDVGNEVTLPPVADYLHYVTWGPYRFFVQIMRNCEVVSYPLRYPDPNDEFYGYAKVQMMDWYAPETKQGLKELVTSATRTARTVIALQGGHYSGSQEETLRLYRQYINDDWIVYLDGLYKQCKVAWRYEVPTDNADREQLRFLCSRTLDYENSYFARYRRYLLGLLQEQDIDIQIFAAEQLQKTVYMDVETEARLCDVDSTGQPALQKAIEQALSQIEEHRRVQRIHPATHPDGLIVRSMVQTDIGAIAKAFEHMNKSGEQYQRYYAENQGGTRLTLVALLDGNVVGYTNVIWQPNDDYFRENNLPEINDMNTVAWMRRRGIGTAMINAAEEAVHQRGYSAVGIGVGSTEDYAIAQRLYPQLGYRYNRQGFVPDPWGGGWSLSKELG